MIARLHTDNSLGFQSVFIGVHPWPDFSQLLTVVSLSEPRA
jgi:hypothetical protein